MNAIASEADRQAQWFGPRLKELRAAKALSQAALAERAGMAQSKIAEYESPTTRYQPSWMTAIRLALALGVSITEFLSPPASTGSGQKKI